MRRVHPLSPDLDQAADVIGGKAHGLVVLRRLGLPVPAGFVIGTGVCRSFRRTGRLPDGLPAELATAVAELEAATGRTLGGCERPLAVSVRSGAAASMPGMMTTILGLGLTAAAASGLATESGDLRFALDSRLRFLLGFAAATTDRDDGHLETAHGEGAGISDLRRAIREVEAVIEQRAGRPVPDDPIEQLELAIAAVFSSWDTSRARTYRELHDIPDDLGTAVVVQAMVFGNRDERSGSGVAFSRDPNTGEPGPFGEVLFGRQGDAVVSGTALTRSLHDLRDREPGVWADLRRALDRVETHHRDACGVEFTFDSGDLWLLQVRPAGPAAAAAVRVATDLADEGVIGRREALLRLSAHHLHAARTPRLAPVDDADVLARGQGACPGVAVGRVATTVHAAVRMAASGPVILVRPQTSPLDMRGIAAAAGVVTARGGPASHAAVVARAMGKPAVVGIADLLVDGTSVRAAGRTVGEGTVVAVDGTTGQVVLGSPPIDRAPAGRHLHRLLAWADEMSGDASDRPDIQRLAAAHAVLT